MKAVNQSQFARILGFSRSAITKFKHAGRLVFTDDGLVDVEASKIRIRETADPNRDDVARRHARERDSEIEQEYTADEESDGVSYQESRAKKEKYLALQAKVDYETSIGSLVERSEVERDWIAVATVLRVSLERLPDSIAAELASETDANRIHAILVERIESVLIEAADRINKV